MAKRKSSFSRSQRRFKNLLRNPFFWVLTLVGNSIVLAGGLLLWVFETNVGGGPVGFLDCLLWSAGTVTTVGYGTLSPQSVAGKVTILCLMLFGTVFVWSYMAFLVTGLIAPELASLERDVHEVEKEVRDLKIEGEVR